MVNPLRGEVWLVDLGMVAKIRPCLIVSGVRTRWTNPVRSLRRSRSGRTGRSRITPLMRSVRTFAGLSPPTRAAGRHPTQVDRA